MAEGPDGGRAIWANASDGVRIRVGVWPREDAKGTILVFPGRTEFIEKYGRTARDLHDAGYAVAAIDWRGQGLAQRVSPDPLLGHVEKFADYQLDVAAFVEAVKDLPKPWYLVAHSMGGCIGYRAVIEGLPVSRAVFSAPMWSINIALHLRPLAKALPTIARSVRQGLRYAPGTSATTYLRKDDFDTNELTSDRDQFAYLTNMLEEVPGLALGGPSLIWVDEALREGQALAELPKPQLPIRTYLGTKESIVSAQAISAMYRNWPDSELIMVQGAMHELMMEAPAMRDQFMRGTLEFFGAN